MATLVLPEPAATEPNGRRGMLLAVATVLAVWFLVVVSFGAAGAFTNPPGSPPLPIAIGAAVPLLLFFASMWLSRSFRDFVLALDLRLIAAIQAWRWAGLGLLALFAHHVLPAMFALPAGLGDMAVGVTAPWMLLGLLREPGFATSAKFIRWNLFGILDLVVALSLGTLSALLATRSAGEVSTASMATLPLLLIPVFLVPIFLMLHTSALLQSRQLIRNRPRAR